MEAIAVVGNRPAGLVLDPSCPRVTRRSTRPRHCHAPASARPADRAAAIASLVADDPWSASFRATTMSERHRRLARARALAGMIGCTTLAVAYVGLAYFFVATLHIGHLVQDGIDTGDMLALPPLLMAVVAVVVGTGCLHRFESLSPRRR